MAQCSPDENEQLEEFDHVQQKAEKICKCKRYIENSWMFKKICKYPVSIQICFNNLFLIIANYCCMLIKVLI